MSNSIREKSTKHNNAVTVITTGTMLTDQAVGRVFRVMIAYSIGIGHFTGNKVTFIAQHLHH